VSVAIAPAAVTHLPELEQIMSRAGRENFPVALRILPASIRRHLLAVYGFARLADDVGDEIDGDRLVLLDALEHELDRVYGGTATHPAMRQLAATVRACALPRQPFDRLIEANRRDQRVRRYESYAALLDYCALSANPIGHLVLGIFGAATPERMELADAICSGLQIVEHCQDVAEDLARNRIYLPAEDLAHFGCREDDLRSVPAPARVRRLVAFEIGRARQLLRAGEPLLRTLRGWARVAVSGYIAGGRAAVDAVEGAGFDVLGATPRVRRRDRLRWMAALLWDAGVRRPA